MQQDNTDTKNSQEDYKKQASKIISNVFGYTEKFVHDVIDKGSELADTAGKNIHKAYGEIKDLLERLDEKDPDDLKYGDLVISPVDIIDATSKEVLIKAGQVFEYNEKIKPHVGNELLEPDQKDLVKYGRIQELTIMPIIASCASFMEEYKSTRIKMLNEQSINK